jgi:hypothetical protein
MKADRLWVEDRRQIDSVAHMVFLSCRSLFTRNASTERDPRNIIDIIIPRLVSTGQENGTTKWESSGKATINCQFLYAQVDRQWT